MKIKILLFTILSFYFCYGQKEFHTYNLSINYNYITNAKVYLTPRSFDPQLRDNYYIFDDIKSFSLEIKRNIYNNYIYLSIGSEYLEGKENLYSVRALVNNVITTLNVEEGFKMFPIEMIAYYIFPFSTEYFTAYMGSGLGLYYGEYFRKIYDIKSKSILSKVYFGILVNSGIDITLFKNLAIKFEMKFRDPEFDFKNNYPKTQTYFNNDKIQLFEDTFYTKVNIDGVNLILGLTYRF